MIARVWAALCGVAAGIAFGPWGSGRELAALGALLAVGVVVRRRPALTATSTLGLAFIAGSLAAVADEADGAALQRSVTATTRCEFYGRVLEHAGGLGTLVAIEPSSCAEGGGAGMTEPVDLAPGTSLAVHGWLRPLGVDAFDRARARFGADVEIVVGEIRAGPINGRFHRWAEELRRALRRSTEHLPVERTGLILGMTIGDTSALPEATLEDLRRAGLTHLLAVSGSNVAIVLALVAFVLHRFSLNLRIIGSLVALAFYIVVVGPEPSVLRAGAMGAIALVALLRGARSNTLSLLGLALIVMLLARPGLLYSVGLHLSAAATAGIVIWAAPLADRFSLLPRWPALALGATLAAQLAVAPVLILTFGEVSLVAPLTNLLAFPAVAPITILGLAAGVVALVHDGTARALMSLVSPIAGWVESVGDWGGGLAWGSVTVPTQVGPPLGVLVALLVAKTLRSSESASEVDAPPREDGRMDEWRWRLHDPEGADMRTTDAFASKEEAEAWMGAEWQSLLEEGAETVSLVQGDRTIYVMGLKEA